MPANLQHAGADTGLNDREREREDNVIPDRGLGNRGNNQREVRRRLDIIKDIPVVWAAWYTDSKLDGLRWTLARRLFAVGEEMIWTEHVPRRDI